MLKNHINKMILIRIFRHSFNVGHISNARAIYTTPKLFGEPPKKKRRIDPAVFKLRVERKIKKHEREIARLEADPKQSIPIVEYQLTKSDIRDLESRPQHTMEEFGLTPNLLRGAQRLWSLYRNRQEAMARKSIYNVMRAQESALEQLKRLDSDLYDRTVEVDDTITIPYRPDHLRRETPPNANYKSPDGRIKNTTKEYVM